MVLPVRSRWWHAGLAVAFVLGWGAATIYRGPSFTSPSPFSYRGDDAFQLNSPDLPGDNARSKSGDNFRGSSIDSAEASIQQVDFERAFREAVTTGDSLDRMLRLREIVGKLSIEQMAAAIGAASRLPEADRYDAFNLIGHRWAEIDINGALNFALQNGGWGMNAPYGVFLDGVLDKWANAAPADAIAWVRSLPPSGSRTGTVATLIHKISRNNPRYAFEILRSQGPEGRNFWAVEHLFASWAEREPEAAVAAANELKGELNPPALYGVARIWAKKNPQAAVAWASGIKATGQRNEILKTVAEEWYLNDPVAVIAWSDSLPDEELRRSIVSGAIAQLATSNLPAAFAQIQSLPDGEGRDQAVQEAANLLSGQDLNAAIQMLGLLPSTPEKSRRLKRVCLAWADSEPRAALDWYFKETDPGLENSVVGGVLSDWMQRSPDEAMAWIQALPAGSMRESAFTNLAAHLVTSDPAMAEQLFAKLPPDTQAIAAQRFSASFVQQDVDKAKAWAEGLPSSPAQGVAFGIIASKLAENNVTTAADWLERLPAGLSRDKAIVGFSDSIVSRDPEAALTWALSISDRRDREQQVEVLAKRWLSTNADEARKWLNDSPQLTREQKYRIRGK